MKSIEFSEDQLANLASVGQELFEDAADPRSRFYKRVLVRPKLHPIRVAAWALIPIAITVCMYMVLSLFCAPGWTFPVCTVALICLYSALTAKSVLIFAVKLYQRVAPASVRNKCRFEPSCSSYMIMCIEKHGALKGALKGIARLKRCGPGDGGFDYP